MKLLKFIPIALTGLIMTSCLTNAILSTVLVDKKNIEARAYGDAIVVNVKCASTVTVTCDASWVSVSEKKFRPGLDDGTNIVITTEPSTNMSKTTAEITIASDDEHSTVIKVTREGKGGDTVKDIDGNVYKVSYVNGKMWIAEDLKSHTYDNQSEAYGRSIKETDNETGFAGRSYLDPSKIADLGTMANYKGKMGFIYNWIAAMGLTADEAISVKEEGEYKGSKRQGICPNGFRLPTRAEYNSLVNYADNIAGYEKGGQLLKSEYGWNDKVGNGTNSLNFNGYPCGLYKEGIYKSVGARTSYWTSTSHKSDYDEGFYKWCMGLPAIEPYNPDLDKNWKTEAVMETGHYENEGMSVRCIEK